LSRTPGNAEKGARKPCETAEKVRFFAGKVIKIHQTENDFSLFSRGGKSIEKTLKRSVFFCLFFYAENSRKILCSI